MKSAALFDKRALIKLIAKIASANDLLMILFAKSTLDYLEFEHTELYVS